MIGRWGGALALGTVAIASPVAADARTSRPRPVALAADTTGLGAFTPAAADPRVAAAFARSGLGTDKFQGGAFRFTPSGNQRTRRAVTVAIRARAVTRTEAAKVLNLASDGLAPSAYNLGASVGWKRFELSGDVAKLANPILAGRESADLGLSYLGNRWATKLDVAGERATGDKPALGLDQSWSVGLGGSYSLTRNLDVTGGVRYKLQRDQIMSLLDNRRDSQAVYLGTTFKF